MEITKLFYKDEKLTKDIIIFSVFFFLFMLFLLGSGTFNLFYGSIEFGTGLLIGGAGLTFCVVYFFIKWLFLRSEISRELDRMVKNDKLTGLINGHEFRNKITEKISVFKTTKDSRKIMCIILGIDRFKTVNQSLGYNVGDEIIIEFSDRIRKYLGKEDILSRINGDEFGVLCFGEESELHDKLIGLREIVHDKYITKNLKHNFTLTASIGAAFCTINYDFAEAETLLKKAQIAMNYSKKSGGGQFNIYHTNMESKNIEDLKLENELRDAIKNNELVVYYQPKYDLSNGKIIGAEALVRWKHPEKGLVPPMQFIKLAEEIGIISDIGNFVLNESCIQINEFKKKGKDIKIAVNISVNQFKESDLVQVIQDIIDSNDVPSSNIELEITESLLMNNIDNSIRILHELKALGIRISIDDFGTGYSSLAYLKQIPANTIKIDRSFVKNVDSSHFDKTIIQTIVLLAHNLGCDVVAEGIETPKQVEILKEFKCDYGQGYYFSKPVPEEEFRKLIEEEL